VHQVMELNFFGTFLPCFVFGKELAKHPGSCIVNISSMAAEKATITRVMGYSASKAAVTNFTRWLSVELSPRKLGDNAVRVNALSPGFFLADQNRRLLINEDDSLTERGNDIIKGTPMKRFGEAEDLIGPLLYLVSDASKFVTGTVLEVDGGFSAFAL